MDDQAVEGQTSDRRAAATWLVADTALLNRRFELTDRFDALYGPGLSKLQVGAPH